MFWTVTKVSIGSGVDYEDLKLARSIRVLGDHILISNDIASFDKELKRYRDGQFRVGQFENLPKTQDVMVIKDLLALPTVEAAKSMLYAYQLEYEKIIDQELENLQSKGLTDDEWYLIDAYILATTGNVMGAATMAQYGGESSKLPDQSMPNLDSRYFKSERDMNRVLTLGVPVTLLSLFVMFFFSIPRGLFFDFEGILQHVQER